jgi:hypothetical protein
MLAVGDCIQILCASNVAPLFTVRELGLEAQPFNFWRSLLNSQSVWILHRQFNRP